MSTFTVTQPSRDQISQSFPTYYDLYLYLIEHVIDVDLKSHNLQEFSSDTQQVIQQIDSRNFNSFINL